MRINGCGVTNRYTVASQWKINGGGQLSLVVYKFNDMLRAHKVQLTLRVHHGVKINQGIDPLDRAYLQPQIERGHCTAAGLIVELDNAVTTKARYNLTVFADIDQCCWSFGGSELIALFDISTFENGCDDPKQVGKNQRDCRDHRATANTNHGLRDAVCPVAASR